MRLGRSGIGPAQGQQHITAYKFATALYANGRYAESIAVMDQAAQWVRQLREGTTLDQFPATMLGALARSMVAYGRPEEGLATVDESLRLITTGPPAHGGPKPEHQGFLLAVRAEALTDLARFDEASDAVAQSFSLIGESRAGQALFAFNARRRLWLASGRAAEALADFGAQPASTSMDPATPWGRHAECAWVAVSAGQSTVAKTEAEAALAGIEASPERDFLREPEAEAARALGTSLLQLGDAQAALAPLRRAETLRRAMLDPKRSLAFADALVALARAKRATGDAAGARTAVAEARAIHAQHHAVSELRARALQAAAS